LASPGELGRLVAKLPMPPGTMTTLFKNPEKFRSTYFADYPGYYDTQDAGIISEEGLDISLPKKMSPIHSD